MAMIAITTSNSMSVNPRARALRWERVTMSVPPKCDLDTDGPWRARVYRRRMRGAARHADEIVFTLAHLSVGCLGKSGNLSTCNSGNPTPAFAVGASSINVHPPGAFWGNDA